ncbi:MAG: M20/M25/M40 family metallo-hydrolase [Sphingomicrobium sp.]
MILKRLGTAFAAFALIGAAPAEAPLDSAASRIRADVEYLSSDALEGRETGSTGHRAAADYVAKQFAAIGLKPGGPNKNWLLEVPFRRAVNGRQKMKLVQRGRSLKARAGDDISLRPSLTEPHRKMEVALVFAGRGINDPVLGINDYASIDARGKVAVVMAGTPPGLPSEVAAHLQSAKEEMAATAGAIGLIELPVPGISSSRSERVNYFTTRPVLDWVDAAGKTGAAGTMRLQLSLSRGLARRLLAGTGHSLDGLGSAARSGQPLPAFDMDARVIVDAVSTWQDFASPEVIGVLPGGDPALAKEHIVLMGHLDHLGVVPNAKAGEDRVYNGALDNAAGVATMLEAARKFAAAGNRPRRSVMFVANTGEERGLLGADYLAAHPIVPANDIVGLVDLDMPLLLYDFTDVAAFGAEHSTIAKTAATAGGSMGIAIAPDPMPEETLFVRSDHYRFVLRGVPAVFLMTGYANGGKQAYQDFFARAYHSVGDDMSQPIRWNAGSRYAELNYRIARAMADANERPKWYAKDYFGERYAAGQAKAAR